MIRIPEDGEISPLLTGIAYGRGAMQLLLAPDKQKNTDDLYDSTSSLLLRTEARAIISGETVTDGSATGFGIFSRMVAENLQGFVPAVLRRNPFNTSCTFAAGRRHFAGGDT